jgi:hypothetical protein
MGIGEIKRSLEHLVYYKDLRLMHTFGTFTLSYCGTAEEFHLLNSLTNKTQTYKDIEICSAVLYELLNDDLNELAE